MDIEIKLQQLKDRLAEVSDLLSSADLLEWDQQTCMPPGGDEARAHALATLRGLAHRLFVTDEVGALLEDLKDADRHWGYDSLEASMVRRAARRYRRESRIPTRLVADIAETAGLAHPVWVKARASADFAVFKPCLAKILGLKRELAEHLAPYAHPYDPLLDEFEPDMTAAQLDPLFGSLKGQLVELVRAIGERATKVSDEILHRSYDIEKQRVLGRKIAERIGYDFDRGRQDESAHPFSTHFSTGDVRITTRFQGDFLPSALFGTIHEVGHAMYEQGVDPALERTGLAEGASFGIHESQSRLWENLVGRSRAFWRFALPELRAIFPDVLRDVDLETFYRAINRVEPSLIRVEADEVTYNLHIIVRFELEKALVAGELRLEDVPGAWNDRYQAYLGIRPPNDGQGVLQDVHWSSGYFGYFPAYSLGNLVAVQFFNQARRALPDLESSIARGEFRPLLGWLRENVYRHGCKFTPVELVQRVTGGPMDSGPYMQYLREKFGQIYGL